MISYAKVVVLGSPITKSNFKLHNVNGRAILPYNSGQYHDRYAIYEQLIAYNAKSQNPDVTLDESLIAVLKVYYKSEKRHPDTINITKSIFDGIEKSGLIVNDSQIRRIIIEESYDKENPRFELELYSESEYSIDYTVKKKDSPDAKILYSPLKKGISKCKDSNYKYNTNQNNHHSICTVCNKKVIDYISADKGKTIICNNCFKKVYKR